MVDINTKLKSYLDGKPNYEKFYILHNEMGYDMDFIKELYPNELKTFDDLKFGPHYMMAAVQAKLSFDNGHFVSVVGGDGGLYGDGVSTFEVGFPTADDFDVVAYVSPEEVTKIMFIIQCKEPYE